MKCRNQLKKYILLLFASLLTTVIFTGCGSSSSNNGKEKILFIMTDTEDTFRNLLSEGVLAAANDSGVSIEKIETGKNVEAQLNLVKTAKEKGYTAIILQPADAEAALQMQVASNDIPIVYINAKPSDSVLEANKYIYVGSKEEQAGQYQAEYVWEKLQKPKSLRLIILEGAKGHSGTIGRTSAVKNYFKDQGVEANIVFADICNWSDTEAMKKLDVFFRTNQEFDAVFCNNDTMALGACEALKKHGVSLDIIPVCGVDATADGCASIKAGDMQFTVLQDAKSQGLAAVQAAKELSNGKDISGIENAADDEKAIWIPFQKVDASNVSQFQ